MLNWASPQQMPVTKQETWDPLCDTNAWNVNDIISLFIFDTLHWLQISALVQGRCLFSPAGLVNLCLRAFRLFWGQRESEFVLNSRTRQNHTNWVHKPSTPKSLTDWHTDDRGRPWSRPAWGAAAEKEDDIFVKRKKAEFSSLSSPCPPPVLPLSSCSPYASQLHFTAFHFSPLGSSNKIYSPLVPSPERPLSEPPFPEVQHLMCSAVCVCLCVSVCVCTSIPVRTSLSYRPYGVRSVRTFLFKEPLQGWDLILRFTLESGWGLTFRCGD